MPPPPPVTPSPHRFISKPQQTPLNTKANETPWPKPRPKQKASATPDTHPQRQTPRFNAAAAAAATAPAPKTKAPQFGAAPRFGHARPSSPKRPRLDFDEPGRFATPRRFVNKHAEPHIEDHQPTHLDDLHYDGGIPDHTTRPPFLAHHHSPIPPPDASQIQDLVEPEPLSPLPHRPVFLHQHSPTKELAEPLPEAFSPRRRGQKFVPGGVAAEVRQWILDTPQVTLHAKRSAQGDEGWRVAVTESRREGIGGMVLVKGVVDGGREVRICLPGAGAGKGRGVGGVREGCVVAIKGVTWDMELDGEVWVVTTEWTALRADG